MHKYKVGQVLKIKEITNGSFSEGAKKYIGQEVKVRRCMTYHPWLKQEFGPAYEIQSLSEGETLFAVEAILEPAQLSKGSWSELSFHYTPPHLRKQKEHLHGTSNSPTNC